ncbi:hypothetical protein THRCLA_22966 [Thraustotheca clavata]|uniref:Uncharacterized protein n=1 Tax=Thraustotheca clavata TaxID=74557 RepID=A0A1V9YKZ8_9STRA|nr:hypothetical protein THRCLA_22966 [Thraustotheca clavata]
MPISANLRQAINFRKEMYQRAKTQGIPVEWTMKAAEMQKHNAYSKTASSFRKFKTNRVLDDKAIVDSINSTNQSVEIQLKQFNRIFHKIIAPADKSLIVNMRDNSDSIIRSFKFHDHHFTADNLVITERDSFHSGAEIEIDILPSTLVQLQWYVNPKRSKSERKNFFPYLTKAHYNLDSFQKFLAFYMH